MNFFQQGTDVFRYDKICSEILLAKKNNPTTLVFKNPRIHEIADSSLTETIPDRGLRNTYLFLGSNLVF